MSPWNPSGMDTVPVDIDIESGLGVKSQSRGPSVTNESDHSLRGISEHLLLGCTRTAYIQGRTSRTNTAPSARARDLLFSSRPSAKKGRFLCVAFTACILFVFHITIPIHLRPFTLIRQVILSPPVRSFIMDHHRIFVPHYNATGMVRGEPPARFVSGVGGVSFPGDDPLAIDPRGFSWLIIMFLDPDLHDATYHESGVAYGQAQQKALEQRDAFRSRWPPGSPRGGISTRFALDITDHKVRHQKWVEDHRPYNELSEEDISDNAQLKRNVERLKLLHKENDIHQDMIFVQSEDYIPVQLEDIGNHGGSVRLTKAERLVALFRSLTSGRANHAQVDLITIMDVREAEAFDLQRFWAEALVPRRKVRPRLLMSVSTPDPPDSHGNVRSLTLSFPLALAISQYYDPDKHRQNPPSDDDEGYRYLSDGSIDVGTGAGAAGEGPITDPRRLENRVGERWMIQLSELRRVLDDSSTEYTWIEIDASSGIERI